MNRGWISLCFESARVARALSVVSGLIFLLSLAVPAATLMLAGRNLETEAQLLARVDDAGARILTIVSTGGGPAIPPSAVTRIAGLDGVAWVVGLGPAFDVRMPVAGRPAPARTIYAAGAPVAFSATASTAGAYISKASASRLGIDGAYGQVEPGSLEIVGWFRADYPLQELNSFVLIPGKSGDTKLDRVVVAVRDVGWTDLVARALPAMIGKAADHDSTIETSEQLLAAREAVGGEVSRQDRELVVALLLGAIGLGCLVVFAGTLTSRRDFGRRRALGASAAQLVSLVLMSTLWPTILGAVVGTLLGSGYLTLALGSLPSWRFPCSIAILTVMGLTASAAIPAAVAATRDPLRVLRVP